MSKLLQRLTDVPPFGAGRMLLLVSLLASWPAMAFGQTPDAEIQMTRSLLTVLRDGGPMLIPLGLCSFLLFVFVFERAISLRRGRVIPKPFVRRFLAQLDDDALDGHEALERCREMAAPLPKSSPRGS